MTPAPRDRCVPAPPMRLWLVVVDGWDSSYYVVRAATEADAKALTRPYGDAEITELTAEGEPAILWDHYADGPASE